MANPKRIVGVDPAVGSDSTGVAVVVFDQKTGKKLLRSMFSTRHEALKAMQKLHNVHGDIPYGFAIGPDGNLKKESDLFQEPKTAMELLSRCER